MVWNDACYDRVCALFFSEAPRFREELLLIAPHEKKLSFFEKK